MTYDLNWRDLSSRSLVACSFTHHLVIGGKNYIFKKRENSRDFFILGKCNKYFNYWMYRWLGLFLAFPQTDKENTILKKLEDNLIQQMCTKYYDQIPEFKFPEFQISIILIVFWAFYPPDIRENEIFIKEKYFWSCIYFTHFHQILPSLQLLCHFLAIVSKFQVI